MHDPNSQLIKKINIDLEEKQSAIWKGKTKSWRENSARNKDPEKEPNRNGSNYLKKKRQKEVKKKQKKEN